MQMNAGIILAGKDPTGMVLEAQKIPANALALERQRMGNDMLRQQKMEADAGKLARMVLSSPDKPNAYKQALGVARQMGFDLSGFPTEYDDAVGERLGMISAITSMGKDARTKLESRVEMMRKAGATEEEIKKAIMIDAGLVPRATGGGETKAPSGFRMRADGNLEPIPGGPADPSYKSATGGGAKPPAGYRMRADGNLEFIPGGPADPKVKGGSKPQTGIAKLESDFKAGLVDEETYKAAKKKLIGGNSFTVQTPDGTTVTYGNDPNRPKLNEGQSKDVFFYTRMKNVTPTLDTNEDAMIAKGGGPSAVDAMAGRAGVFGNFVKSDEYRKYEQSAREWIAAMLRKDTGAAVTDTEWELYFPMYFIQPGDDAAVQKQKRDARARVIDAFKIILPPGYREDVGEGEGAPPAKETPARKPISEMTDEELLKMYRGE